MEYPDMSVYQALTMARDVGITFATDGYDLILKAAAPPPDNVIDLLAQHKAEVLAMLAAIEYERNENGRAAPRVLSKTVLAEGEPGLEQPCAARRGRVARSGDVLLHFCVECGRFGPYGYDVRLRTGQAGRWYCREHRPKECDEVKP
jgi:hypothetical protein